jgi:hypothetical protein
MADNEPRERKQLVIPGTEWVDVDSYMCAWGKYLLECPQDRTCQVGVGILWRGEPAGEKIRFSGSEEIIVIGVGTVRIRVDDGKGPCEIKCWMQTRGTIGVND